MRKTVFGIFAIIILSCSTMLFAAENPFFLPPSALSVSSSEGSFSSLINPVFTDTGYADDIAYRYLKYSDIDAGNHFALINLLGFDFIYTKFNSIPGSDGVNLISDGIDMYSINRGLFLWDIIGIGAGYSFTRSDGIYGDYHGWTFGFLYRPVSFLSIGAVSRDVNGEIDGEKIDPTSIFSISIRPWEDYLTLGIDCEKRKGEDPRYSYSAHLKGYKDISLILKYNTDKSITAGLVMPLFFRFGGGAIVNLDAFGSGGSEPADFRSAGVSLKFKKDRDPVQIALSDNYVLIKISDNYTSERDVSGLFTRREETFHDLVRGISMAGNDPSISGIVLEIENSGFGMAQTEELRELLKGIRQNGKKVYSVLKYPDNREYYLATASDRIFMPPNTTFKLTGLSAKLYFFRGLLDKAGVRFESFSKGKYKSFSEAYTRVNMSEAARENLTGIITELNEQFIAGIVEGRGIERKAIEDLFKKGFYTPTEAKDKGFIDEVVYFTGAMNTVVKNGELIHFEDYISEDEVPAVWGITPAVAVISVTGSIVSGEVNSSMSDSIGDTNFEKYVEAAFSDSSVKAVVIRIDSGGGSAAASDFMLNTLKYAKMKSPKPVIFSFGNIAASGGYYIACTGDSIFAGKGTITGSIGVVAGKVTAEELFAKIGVSTETVKMSEFADIFSESRGLTEKEKDLFRKEVDFIYDRFTGMVMEGRSITKQDISSVAEGRVHTGEGAKKNRLVNENGGLIAAIEFAKIKGGIDTPYSIINYPENGSIFKGAFDGDEVSAIARYMKFLITGIEREKLLRERVLYIQPYVMEIE